MLRQARATGLAIYLLASPLCCLFSSCKMSADRAKFISSHANINIEKGTGVEINYSERGRVKIRAMGPSATRFNTNQPYMEFTDGIKIIFFGVQGDTESTLTAKYATTVENSHSMTARDSVVVINNKGERLNTDELIWDEEKKTIYSNSFVKITTPDEIIYGNGMTANENFTDYVIKNITGTVKVKDPSLP